MFFFIFFPILSEWDGWVVKSMENSILFYFLFLKASLTRMNKVRTNRYCFSVSVIDVDHTGIIEFFETDACFCSPINLNYSFQNKSSIHFSWGNLIFSHFVVVIIIFIQFCFQFILLSYKTILSSTKASKNIYQSYVNRELSKVLRSNSANFDSDIALCISASKVFILGIHSKN